MKELNEDTITDWLVDVHGTTAALLGEERGLRLAEEAIEAAQAAGVSRSKLHALVDQVMDKPVGAVDQEIGGVMVTAYAYATCFGVDADKARSKEWGRIQDPQIMAKILSKVKQKRVVSKDLAFFFDRPEILP